MKKYVLLMALVLAGCSTTKTSQVVNQNRLATGTGFNLTHKGKVYGVTAAHVCAMAQAGYLTTFDGKKNVKLPILAHSHQWDVCVLAEIPGLPAFKENMSEADLTNNATKIIGYPTGAGKTEVTTEGLLLGIAGQLGKYRNEDDGACPTGTLFIGPEQGDDEDAAPNGIACYGPVIRGVTDAQAYRGNSGGPVVLSDGSVVGVVTSIGALPLAPSYFSPIEAVIDLINSLEPKPE